MRTHTDTRACTHMHAQDSGLCRCSPLDQPIQGCGNRRPNSQSFILHNPPAQTVSDSTSSWPPRSNCSCSSSLPSPHNCSFFSLSLSSEPELQAEDNKCATSLTVLDRPQGVNQTGRPKEDLVFFFLSLVQSLGSRSYFEKLESRLGCHDQQWGSAEPH